MMASHLSRKRDEEIGRFGLGFKSVLGVSDAPEIISRGVSIRFDRDSSARLARSIDPTASRTPVLRMGTPFDPTAEATEDSTLDELMSWASTIVRLPLRPDVDWLGDSFSPSHRSSCCSANTSSASSFVTYRVARAGTGVPSERERRSRWCRTTVPCGGACIAPRMNRAPLRERMPVRSPAAVASTWLGRFRRRGAHVLARSGRTFRPTRGRHCPASSMPRSRRMKTATTFSTASTIGRF